MSQKVLVRDKKGSPEKPVRTADASIGWTVAIAGGVAIAIVGWTDILMAWYPLQFGSLEWEFGTISRTFDGLPLGTVGLLGIVAGLAAGGRRRGMLVMSAILAVITLVLIGLAGLYLLDAAPAWAASAPPVRETLKVAFIRTPIFIVTYVVLYSWMTWFTWRQWRRTAKVTET